MIEVPEVQNTTEQVGAYFIILDTDTHWELINTNSYFDIITTPFNNHLSFALMYVHQGELILKFFQKLPMDTQGFPYVTVTKRYDLVWDSGGTV